MWVDSFLGMRNHIFDLACVFEGSCLGEGLVGWFVAEVFEFSRWGRRGGGGVVSDPVAVWEGAAERVRFEVMVLIVLEE